MAQTADALPETKKLYIGEGVTINGQVAVPDTLVVCGMLEGDMSVGNLSVGESGVIKGRISVSQNADVSGKVFEKLEVKNLLILRKGTRSMAMSVMECCKSSRAPASWAEFRPPPTDRTRRPRRAIRH
jgi:cytoskeletal protein CcmA (bactofilin family)